VLTGAVDPLLAGAAYADLADACLVALAPPALAEVVRRAGVFPGSVAVLALGSAGSREMTARSDLDLMVLYEAEPGALSGEQGWRAETVYGRFAQRLVSALSSPTAEGVLYPVDMRLRPSGADGPLAVSLPAFRAYYGEEAEAWELMALTRARVVWADPPAFAEEAAAAIRAALRRPRDRARLVADVRAMRTLLADERPPRGPWDLKHAPGGLVDIEFAAQSLHLAYAHAAGPFGTGVEDVLLRCGDEGQASPTVLATLLRAWRLHQALSQVLKAALDEGSDPSGEPAPFGRKLARAGGARTFAALQARLARTQAAAHRAYLSVLRATERKP
jgi:glutamate-ammonia-ligase adenylyltransferase